MQIVNVYERWGKNAAFFHFCLLVFYKCYCPEAYVVCIQLLWLVRLHGIPSQLVCRCNKNCRVQVVLSEHWTWTYGCQKYNAVLCGFYFFYQEAVLKHKPTPRVQSWRGGCSLAPRGKDGIVPNSIFFFIVLSGWIFCARTVEHSWSVSS